RSGRDYFRELMNGPAFKRMVGCVSGKRVLDLACGEGDFSRYFAGMGADVTGVDFSEEMIKAAVEEEKRSPLGIVYHVADAADLRVLGSESFDVVYIFMAMMDIPDHGSAIGEAARVLKRGGRFIFIMVHPCFGWARRRDGEVLCDWERRVHGDGSKEYLYLKIYDYFQRHTWEIEWKNEAGPQGFKTTQFHRTLSEYVNTLGVNGLYVTRMEEPRPVEGGSLPPNIVKLFRVPHTILIEARKLS
ncbi:MAG: class I SAM-dependent methyltransferase, partial [Candidatus Bathyarchaeota archaeon]|nr:class I SAM-dependent methyltransferase [Candidatus Bathyarchaeota archaeon]